MTCRKLAKRLFNQRDNLTLLQGLIGRSGGALVFVIFQVIERIIFNLFIFWGK